MEGLCPCGHEPTGSIVPVSQLVNYIVITKPFLVLFETVFYIFNKVIYIVHLYRNNYVWAGRPGFDPGCRRSADFSSLLRVHIGPGVHSASYKMSTGAFPGNKGGRAQDQPPYFFLVPWLCICEPLYPHPSWAFLACKGIGLPLPFNNYV